MDDYASSGVVGMTYDYFGICELARGHSDKDYSSCTYIKAERINEMYSS
jgi:hypothetical protein